MDDASEIKKAGYAFLEQIDLYMERLQILRVYAAQLIEGFDRFNEMFPSDLLGRNVLDAAAKLESVVNTDRSTKLTGIRGGAPAKPTVVATRKGKDRSREQPRIRNKRRTRKPVTLADGVSETSIVDWVEGYIRDHGPCTPAQVGRAMEAAGLKITAQDYRLSARSAMRYLSGFKVLSKDAKGFHTINPEGPSR